MEKISRLAGNYFSPCNTLNSSFSDSNIPNRPAIINNHNLATERRIITLGVIIIIIIIMAGMAVFNVAGYLIEERRKWPVITASPRGQCSK